MEHCQCRNFVQAVWSSQPVLTLRAECLHALDRVLAAGYASGTVAGTELLPMLEKALDLASEPSAPKAPPEAMERCVCKRAALSLCCALPKIEPGT